MTRGVCHPETFQGCERSRVFEHAVSNHPGALSRQIQQLHNMGAQYVYVDKPMGKVTLREGYRALRRVTRDQDTIILGEKRCLGRDGADKRVSALEAEGIEVAVLINQAPP